jgi:hypothetical protein
MRESVVMKSSTKRRGEIEAPGLIVRTEWGSGPRTSAWDRLWRIILSDLDRASTTNSGQQIGREGDDG